MNALTVETLEQKLARKIPGARVIATTALGPDKTWSVVQGDKRLASHQARRRRQGADALREPAMSRVRLLIAAGSLLVGCNTAGACAEACRGSGLQFAAWDGKSCTCLTPPKCELEQRAADVTMTRAEFGVALFEGCNKALAVCRAGGGR